FNFAGGAQAGQTIDFNFGIPRQILGNGGVLGPNPSAPTGFEGTTQFAGPSSTLQQSQDGYGSGVLQSFSIDEQGKVRGLFSDGPGGGSGTRTVAQIRQYGWSQAGREESLQ